MQKRWIDHTTSPHIYNQLANNQSALTLSTHSKYPSRGKTIHIFIRPPDRHAAFMTSLRLNAIFAMTSRAIHNSHPVAPDAPPVLRSKPANLPPSGFEAQTGKPAASDVDACPTSRQVPRRLQDLRAPLHGQPTRTCHRLPPCLADAVFITFMYSCSSAHHMDRP